MNFLVDAQLPPALARWIDGQGHRATHILEMGLQAADDAAIWERAQGEKSVIIRKDEDFVDHWLLSAEPVQLVWIRKGNCSSSVSLEWLQPLWPDVAKRLAEEETLIELRA